MYNYGGLAVINSPVYKGESKVVEVVDNGFNVYYTFKSSTTVAEVVRIYTNVSGDIYNYIAIG